MTTIEEFEQEYRQFRTKYFEKHFVDKDIRDVMYEISKEVVVDLASLYAKTCMLVDTFSILRSDKDFFNGLDDDTKQILKSNIVSLKILCRKLYNILKPIQQGLSEEM